MRRLFDSVPGAGFNTHPMAAAIVPPAGAITGTGSHVAIDPAETNAFRALNLAWKANGQVSRAGGRYVISGLNDSTLNEIASSLAIRGERVATAGQAIKKPRLALFEPPNSMDAGWTKWVLERYGFEFTSVTTPDLTGNLRDRFDVIVVGDERRGILPAGGFGRQAPAAPTADDEAKIKALDAFVQKWRHAGGDERQRGGGDRSAEAAGAQRARRRRPRQVLRGWIGDARHHGSVTAGDGRHAEGAPTSSCSEVRRSRPRRDSMARCSRRIRTKARRFDPVTCWARSTCMGKPPRSTRASVTAT